MIFKVERIKKSIAKLLLFIYIFTMFGNMNNVYAANQSNILGTNAALGSPLVSDNFTIDNWDTWEMLCFGIFLSNFCQPFEDDYTSAFTEGSNKGTNGRGLKALQFAAGGDATTSGYLADMVNYCKEIQAQSYKDIYVSYGYWEYNRNVNNSVTGSPRRAYFDDLIPLLSKFTRDNLSGDIEVLSNALIKNPVVSYGVFHHAKDIIPDTDLYLENVNKTYVDFAVLPTFYTSKNKEDESIIFDMTENWDIQILKALFAKTFNKESSSDFVASDEDGIGSALDDVFKDYLGQKCPLSMDTFGNICMQYNGRQVIVIPSSANQHITKNKSYNYLNSLVLNNFVMYASDVEAKVVANAEETPISKVEGWWTQNVSQSVGNFPVRPSDEISTGKLLITSDTDTQFMPWLYEYMKSQDGGGKSSVTYYMDNSGNDTTATETTTESGNVVREEINLGTQTGKGELMYTHKFIEDNVLNDLPLGKYIHDILDQNSFVNQPIQFQITGATSWVEESSDKGWFGLAKGESRDSEEATIETTLGAYGLLSTLIDTSGTVSNKDILDYYYAYDSSTDLESTKQSLFNGSYYLSPNVITSYNKGEDYNSNAGKTSQSLKLYVNYYCKVMDGSNSINLTMFDDTKRNEFYSILARQKGLKETNYALLSSEDITSELKNTASYDTALASPIYKSFLKQLYVLDNDYEEIYNSESSSIIMIDSIFSGADEKISGYDISKLPDYNLGTLARIVKVYKPSASFSTISSIFGLEDGCQFELYSTYVYVTYLYFYGLLGSSHNFNETLFKDGYFKAFTGENFTNGVTKEQMEDQVKLNVYKLLSLNKDGDKYRSQLISSFIKTTFVEPLDKKLNAGGIGNVGAETSFLKVAMLEDNFLIGDIIKEHWKDVSMILFGLLSIIAILSGALNNKTLGWYFTILVASASLTFTVPYYLDIAPIVIEKYINGHYKNTGSYWALAESIEYDKNTRDLYNSSADDTKVLAVLNTLNFLDTDSSLMVKLDISQKVISNTSVDAEKLQGLKTARWLLPSLMKQMSSKADNYDYVSVPVTRLYDNFSKIWIMYNGVSESDTLYNKNVENIGSFGLMEKESNWFGYDDKNLVGYKSTAPKESGASNSTKSVSRVNSENSEPTHTKFYMLDNLKVQSVYDVMGKEYMTRDDWNEFAKKVSNNDGIQPQNFVEEANSILSNLNTYNQYETQAKQEFGYLWTTENLGTYFYTVVKDTFDEAGAGKSKNLPYLMIQLQGSTSTNQDGKDVRSSFMHYLNTGYERDVCDMEEVFTNLMPYMYQMMILANGNSDHNGLLGSAKMVGNAYYSNNYLSWLFRCNWVTKIYEDNLYSGKAHTVSRDENGEITGEYTIQNMSDPRCYPSERPMVFSEAQMHLQNLSRKDLTFTEIKILDFNSDVVRRWTTLINYANSDGLTKEHIYRQMAMEALFAFNETFTRDNFIMTEKTLYPTSFDLRSISLITILRSLTCNLTKSNSYMYGDLAVGLYENYGFLGYLTILIMYYSMIFFGWVRDLYMVIAFVSAIATLIFNFGSNSKNKFKAMGGWVITSVLFCGITMFYYWLINFLVGNPTVDTLVNFNTIASSKLSSIPFFLWGLFILLLTIAYIAVIVVYFYELWIGHKFGLSIKDGGFGFYYQLADKATKAISSAQEKVGKKFDKTFGNLKNWGPGADVKKQKVEEEEVEKKKAKSKKNNNEDLSGSDMNSNYNNGNVSSGANSDVTNKINKQIEDDKKSEASVENQKRADIDNSNNTTNNINVNVTNSKSKDDSFAKEANKRIDEDIKKESKS